VEVETIGHTLETLLGGRQVTRFKREGKQYDVMVQLEDKNRAAAGRPDRDLRARRDGRLVQLSNLVTVRETVAPKELNHFNRCARGDHHGQRRRRVRSGRRWRPSSRWPSEELPKSSAPRSTASRASSASPAPALLIFVLALAFIYLVLAAQFESFVGPLVIMLTVPLAVTGALLAMWLTGNTLNVYSRSDW
jgi:multidrug efflux pump